VAHHDEVIGNGSAGEFLDARDEVKDGETVEQAVGEQWRAAVDARPLSPAAIQFRQRVFDKGEESLAEASFVRWIHTR
jgi:hypothetical protein